MQLFKPGTDDACKIWEDLGQVARQERTESSDEADALGAATIKPVETVPAMR
jgi:hypothetical protein